MSDEPSAFLRFLQESGRRLAATARGTRRWLRSLPYKKMALWLAGAVVVGVLAAVFAVWLTIRHFSSDLPDVTRLESEYSPPQVTRILARDDTLLANIFSERRTVVPFATVPDHVKSAFLAAEDAAFYEHEGLDYLGMLRALVVNLRAGSVKQGGSTITQQVVKNVLLDQERSYRRKIRETILAYRIEQLLTKDQILGMYLNHIYLGHGRYGVEEAARYQFGKHVQELDVAEAALLAGIVAAPERYSPRRSEAKALARREYVLGQMLAKGFMTRRVYEDARQSPLRLSPTVETESDIAPEVVRHTRRLLDDVVGERARKGGYTVRTTIDPALQVLARQALRHGLDDYLKRQKLAPPFTLEERKLWGPVFRGQPHQHGIYVGRVVGRDDREGTIDVSVGDVLGQVDLREEERYNPTHLSPQDFVGPGAALRVRVMEDPQTVGPSEPVPLRLELGPQGAVIALDPSSREVLAAVGSYEALPGGLDRTVQAKRQPGSTFKPIVYSYALSTGEVTPAARFEFERDEGSPSAAEPPDAPTRDRGLEVVSLREGIAQSDNRVARAVFRQVGGRQVVQWAEALGVVSELRADESLALGSYEVTPLEMANVFAAFASGGKVAEPRFFVELLAGAEPLALPDRPPQREVMDPAVAYVMTHLLQSVIESGTAKRARRLRRPLAGKTGTTNRAKDTWFVGYSTDLVVAVWVGFDDAHPLGWGESGARSALPIWMEVMEKAHEGKPATEFPRPSNVIDVELDPATGLLAPYGQEQVEHEVFVQGTEPQVAAAPSSEAGLGGAPARNGRPSEPSRTSGPRSSGPSSQPPLF